MKLTKAIEIQTIHNDHNPNFTDKERQEAHQLGIEALTLVRQLQGLPGRRKSYWLPGQTKE